MVTHKGLVTSIAQKVDGENPNIYVLHRGWRHLLFSPNVSHLRVQLVGTLSDEDWCGDLDHAEIRVETGYGADSEVQSHGGSGGSSGSLC